MNACDDCGAELETCYDGVERCLDCRDCPACSDGGYDPNWDDDNKGEDGEGGEYDGGE